MGKKISWPVMFTELPLNERVEWVVTALLPFNLIDEDLIKRIAGNMLGSDVLSAVVAQMNAFGSAVDGVWSRNPLHAAKEKCPSGCRLRKLPEGEVLWEIYSIAVRLDYDASERVYHWGGLTAFESDYFK